MTAFFRTIHCLNCNNSCKMKSVISLISGGIITATDTFSIDRTLTNYEKLYTELLTSRKN